MTLIPLTQVASMLAIDAKTLRKFLKTSSLSLQAHPTDGRVKCLTTEQVQQLAGLSGRPLTPHTAPAEAPPAPSAALVQNPPTTLQLQAGRAFPSESTASDLISRLCSLEATVSTLQQQVTLLALELLREHDLRLEQELLIQTARISPPVEPLVCKPSASVSSGALPPARPAPNGDTSSLTQRRAHSRILSLVEYCANGTYVIISPPQGELFLIPDSKEWFDWLATLSSFRFLGRCGRFSAIRETRHGPMTRRWIAKRSWHNYKYSYYLGPTDRLTLSSLEQAAVALESRTTSR